jgi:hypothetical protein
MTEISVVNSLTTVSASVDNENEITAAITETVSNVTATVQQGVTGPSGILDLYPLGESLKIGGGDDYLEVETDGTLRFAGEATAWDDLTEALTGKNLNTSAGKANYDFANAWVRLESGGNLENDADAVMATFQTRHRMKTPSTLHFHLHWLQSNATARTISGKYRVIQNGVVAGAWQNFSASCTYGVGGDNIFAFTAANLGQITNLFALDATGFGLSTMIQVRITRSDSNANADIYALYLDAHYECDGMGSRTEYL